MKITIQHNQNSVDPGETCSDEQFESVIDSLEREYESAMRKSYPEAEIEFERTDCCGAGIIVTGIDDPIGDDRDEIQRICELVYETGNFWV